VRKEETMSTATKYARATLETDALLRRRAANGARVHVTHKEVSEEINVVQTTASTILSWMAKNNTGLCKIKGGQYEYRTPAQYPQSLKDLKEAMRNPKAPVSHPSLQNEFVEWYGELEPGAVFTTATAAKELQARTGSVSGVIRRLLRGEVIELVPGTKTTYRKPRTVESHLMVVDNLQDEEQPEIVASTDPSLVGQKVEIPVSNKVTFDPGDEGTAEHEITFSVPTPKTMAEAVERKAQAIRGESWEELGKDKFDNIVLRGPDGVLYQATPL
jgi:hypothetical protein